MACGYFPARERSGCNLIVLAARQRETEMSRSCEFEVTIEMGMTEIRGTFRHYR